MGLEVSPGSLGQDHVVQRQIRHGTPELLVLVLKLLQPFELIPTDAAIFLAPSIIGLLRYADLPNILSERVVLSLQHFNLPQLQHDFFGFVLLSSHLLVLLKSG